MTTIAKLYKNGKFRMTGKIIEDFSSTQLTPEGNLKTFEIIEKRPELYFNGIDGSVVIPNANNRLQPTQQITWELWFKIKPPLVNHATLMGFGTDHWDITFKSTNKIICHWYSNTGDNEIIISGMNDLNDDNWHHLAVVYDGINGDVKGYVDLVNYSNSLLPANSTPQTTMSFPNFSIGGSVNGTTRLFSGYIKNVRMWNIIRTKEEIKHDLYRNLKKDKENLIMNLTLDEGSGNKVYDKTINFNHGTTTANWKNINRKVGMGGASSTSVTMNNFKELINHSILTHGIEITADNLITSGGVINENKSIDSSGTTVFTNYFINDYSPYIHFINSNSITIGDIWIDKKDNLFKVKNTGEEVDCKSIILHDDFKYIIDKYQGVFNGQNGVKIPRIISNNDFIYVIPLEENNNDDNTHYADIGEIYIKIVEDGFIIYNSGEVGRKFEWMVLNTKAEELSHIEINELILNSEEGVTGEISNKTIKNILISTPIILDEYIPGSNGVIYCTNNDTSYTIYNTGEENLSKVRCLIIKDR